MTAKEHIKHAMSLTVDNSMYELSKAKNILNDIAGTITTPELIEDWNYAMEHINDTMRDQEKLARAGKQIRIY
jgi:hypothetical protein